MHTDLARLDLRIRRRGLWAYTVGMGAYAALIVAIYPSFKDDSSLNALANGNPTMAAMLGISGSLTSPAGWMNGNVYANFLPLVVLLMTIGYGATAIAGQDEDGLLGLVATLPLSRRSLVLQKTLSLAVIATPVAVVTMLATLVGRRFDHTLDQPALAGTTVALIVLGIDFGLLALLIGAVTGSRSTALGTTSGVAALAYVVSSLAPAVHGVHAIRWASPFYWAVGNGQLTAGVGTAAWVALLGAGAVLLGACLWAVRRMDIH